MLQTPHDRWFSRCRNRSDLGRPAQPALPSDIQPAALRKLRLINNARRLDDLRIPPGNRLEGLRDDRIGQHSIRINDQWRICSVWRDNHAHQVEIVDYH